MAKLRGWSVSPSGQGARGAYYSRWADRKNKRGLEFVEKHSGRVYRNVVKVNGVWTGQGFLGIEPKYANLSGKDSKLESSPNITLRQLNVAQRTGKAIKFDTIRLRKPIMIKPSLRR